HSAILSKFPDLLKPGIGRYTGPPQKLLRTTDCSPTFVKFRIPAYSLTDAIEEEIRSLVKDDVLEKVESSDWATPIVVVPKSNNRVRICGDFKVTVNKNIRVDRHPMPRVEDIFNKLQGGLTFTTIDIRQ